ncbi:ABC transporter permease [Methylobacterium sp. A54F]
MRGRALRRGAVVLGVLALAGALYGLPVLRLARNRLVTGEPVFAPDAMPVEAALALALAAAAGLLAGAGRSRLLAWSAATLLATAFCVTVHGLGAAATDLSAGQPPAARVGLAAGAWCALALLGAGLGLAAARTRRAWAGAALAATLAGAVALMGWAGTLGGLSLAVEFGQRREAVAGATLRHVLLAGGAVGLAALVTAGLAPVRRLRGPVEMLAGGVQVVPAIALFGALVALLSGLLRALPALREAGLGALGPTPALLGIAAYLVLPLWRGLAQALRAADPAVLDAATGLGLGPRQVLLRVRLPLGAPALIGALRVACVQAIGLATLGALIGAGGLGSIVFDGMAQFAPDLILVGAVPVVALSLAVERGLSALEAAAGRWRA